MARIQVKGLREVKHCRKPVTAVDNVSDLQVHTSVCINPTSGHSVTSRMAEIPPNANMGNDAFLR